MEISQNEREENLNLLTINLPDNYGGEQLIIRHQPLNDKQFVVATLGNGPKIKAENETQETVTQAVAGVKDPVAKKLLESIKHHLPIKNKKTDAQTEQTDQAQANIKLRFFKLTQIELKNETTSEGKYSVDEYITPESIAKAARACGFDQREPEIEK